jgi:nucleotide-binding universal stress UspA family protein
MKILLPVDGSEHTKRMLSYLAAHDELLGAGHEYTVFTAVMAIPPHATHFVDRKTLGLYYDEQAELVLKPVRAYAEQRNWRISWAHAHGHAADEIVAFATEQKIDLIVMGTHGHSALGNVILGSVTTGVLARCKIPVLLIR